MILLTELLLEIKLDGFTSQIVNSIFSSIKSSNKSFKKIIEFSDPLLFDLELTVKRTPDIASSDLYFKNENSGFAIDADSFLDANVIEVNIELDPSKEPNLYNSLSGILKDYVRHELEHINQIQVQGMAYKAAGKGYKYFISPDEIPAMVKGMNKRAKHERVPVEKIFNEYLDYVVKKGDIKNQKEREKVFNIWMEFAKKNQIVR